MSRNSYGDLVGLNGSITCMNRSILDTGNAKGGSQVQGLSQGSFRSKGGWKPGSKDRWRSLGSKNSGLKALNDGCDDENGIAGCQAMGGDGDDVNKTVLDEIEKLTHSNGSDVVCVYCREEIAYFCIGACNHPQMCPICTIRNVTIYKRNFCGICKQNLETIYVVNRIRDYEEMKKEVQQSMNLKEKFIFEDAQYYELWKRVFRFECILCPEEVGFFGSLGELEVHLSSKHERFYCQVCLTGRGCFLSRQVLYTREGLSRHMSGVNLKGVAVEPHKSCDYCKVVFFDNSSILDHCNKVHERCHVCIRFGYENYYYENYAKLEKHFFDFHFPCTESECLEKKFVVFESKFQLVAHISKRHARGKGVYIIGDGSNLKCGNRPRIRSHPMRSPEARVIDNESPVFYPDSILQFDITGDLTPSNEELSSARMRVLEEEFPSLNSAAFIRGATSATKYQSGPWNNGVNASRGHNCSLPHGSGANEGSIFFDRKMGVLNNKFKRWCQKTKNSGGAVSPGDLKDRTLKFLNGSISADEYFEFFKKFNRFEAIEFCTEVANLIEDAHKKAEILSCLDAHIQSETKRNSSSNPGVGVYRSSGRAQEHVENNSTTAVVEKKLCNLDLEFPSLSANNSIVTPMDTSKIDPKANLGNHSRKSRNGDTQTDNSIWKKSWC